MVTLAPLTVLTFTYVMVRSLGRLLLIEAWHRSPGGGAAVVPVAAVVPAAAVAEGARNSAPAAAGATGLPR